MEPYYFLYSVILVIGISISIYLLARLWTIRKTPGAFNLVVAISGVVVWSFAYIFEILFDRFGIKLACSKAEYLGIPFVSYGIFIFSLVYSGRAKWLTRGRLISLGIIPAVTSLLAITNDWHHLLWSEVRMPVGGFIGPLTVGKGPWYNINVAYSYILLLLATFFFAQIAFRSRSLYRSQAIVMLVGMIIPWISNIIYMLRLGPVPSLDLTPLALTLTAVALVIGFMRFGLMDILPIAHATVFNAMRDGVIVTDGKGRIVDINPAVQHIFQFHDDHLIGQDICRIFPAWAEWNIGPGNISGISQEITLGQEHDQRIYSLKITPILDHRGQVTGQITTLTDITGQKQAEEQLRKAHQETLEANRMQTQLLANVSHDLRTPLGAIMGYAEMIQSGVLGLANAQQQKAAAEILDSTNQLQAFVNNLIGEAQIETGHLVLREGEFRPSELFDGIYSTLNYMAQKKGLVLETVIDTGLPSEINGDAYWLKQIVLNLANNAIKFTEKGSVKVALLLYTQGRWAIQVEDTGIGIPEDSQKVIFEAFRQIDSSATRKHGGSGLGLSIVQQLTTLMGGEIELKSKPGQGSIFTIALPLNHSCKISIAPNQAGKHLALIIEDDTNLVTIFTQAMKMAGFETQSISDGQEAMALLKAIQPTVIILDLHLPGADGDRVLACIRQDERLKDTQVILATADPLMADMLLNQSDYVLQKPVSFSQLRDLATRIRSALV